MEAVKAGGGVRYYTQRETEETRAAGFLALPKGQRLRAEAAGL